MKDKTLCLPKLILVIFCGEMIKWRATLLNRSLHGKLKEDQEENIFFRWKRQVKHAYIKVCYKRTNLNMKYSKLTFFSRIILMVERKFTKEGRKLRILGSLLFFATKFFVKTCRRFLSVLSLIQLIIQCQSINSTGKGQVE